MLVGPGGIGLTPRGPWGAPSPTRGARPRGQEGSTGHENLSNEQLREGSEIECCLTCTMLGSPICVRVCVHGREGVRVRDCVRVWEGVCARMCVCV